MPENWVELVRSRKGYESLLDKVLGSLPQDIRKAGDRTIVVNPVILHESRRTIITNFTDIAEALNRPPQHLAKFISKESGKPGTLEGDRLLIQGRMTNDELRRLLSFYVKEFVKCPLCGGFDTRIVVEKRLRFLVCEVCGAKNPVRKL